MFAASCLTLALAASPAAFPPLPEGFSSFGAAVADGFVYVYGGHAGKTHSYSTDTTLGKFRRLNIADPAKGWEELPGGEKLQGLALVAHKGSLIRVGGMSPRNAKGQPADNRSVATVERFDPKANAWAKLPDLPAPRSSHDAVVVGDTLVVAGGWRMNGADGDAPAWADTALTLNLADPKAAWKSVPQPFQRRALAVVALDTKVYVIGGLTPKMDGETGTDVLDLHTGSWAKGPGLPGDRMNSFTPGAAVSDGKIYVNPIDGKVYRLAGDKWEEVSSVPTPRFVHRLVPLPDGRLLAVGGASHGKGNVAACEVVGVK